MKLKESSMPEEKMWKKFFNPDNVLKTLGIDNSIINMADFGCGYGIFTIPAAKIIRGKIYAIDIEPEMIKVTQTKARKNKLNNVETMLRDVMAEGSGLRNESVDYAMLFNVLYTTEQPEKLLEEAYRILRQNGKLGIIHWNYDQATPRGPPMDMRPKPEQCIEWGKSSGFELQKKYDLKPYHYGMVFKKNKAGQKNETEGN